MIEKKSFDSQDYAENLNDVFNLYNLESNSEHFKEDLEFFGYVEIRENMFERSYDKYRCEVVKFDDKSLEYYITDTCYSVVGNSIIQDYDNNGNTFLYYATSYTDVSTLTLYTEKEVTLITYNHTTGEEYIHFDNVDLIFGESIARFNVAYYQFINKINAIMF